jgi:hypothetical protein
MYLQGYEQAQRREAAVDGFAGYFGGVPAVAATCAPYSSGEVDKSRSAAGHLTPDVIEHARGLVIRDFGVDWRHVKSAVGSEPALKKWVQEIVQVIRANPATTIRILGFSDCVGPERDNRLLRRGRAQRVQQLLQQMAGSAWPVLKPKIGLVDSAPIDDYLDVNSTVAGRAGNRAVLIESTRSITFDDPDVVQMPDTLERIIKRGLDLILTTEHFGERITKPQQDRIRCLLTVLSRPPYDDRFLTGQGVLDYMNMTHMSEPYYGNATQWLLPQFAVRSKKLTPDPTIWRTLIRIDDDITLAIHTINRYYATHGAATPIRIQRMRNWIADQQKNDRSIYRCYR